MYYIALFKGYLTSACSLRQALAFSLMREFPYYSDCDIVKISKISYKSIKKYRLEYANTELNCKQFYKIPVVLLQRLPITSAVLFGLLKATARKKNMTKASIQWCANELNLSKMQIYRAFRILESKNYIRKYKNYTILCNFTKHSFLPYFWVNLRKISPELLMALMNRTNGQLLPIERNFIALKRNNAYDTISPVTIYAFKNHLQTFYNILVED